MKEMPIIIDCDVSVAKANYTMGDSNYLYTYFQSIGWSLEDFAITRKYRKYKYMWE